MSTLTRLTREEFEAIIKNYEATGKDTTELKKALTEAYPPKPVKKQIVNRGALSTLPQVKFVSPEILEIESHYSLIELRDMARKEGFKYTGTKDELCLKLISAGVLRRG